MATPIIQLKKINKQFGSKAVLLGADLVVKQGKTTVVIGKSGAGKSVLLKCIAGLMEVDSGEILFDGIDINTLSRREREAKKCKLSYMFQNNALFDSLTAFDNVALPLRERTNLSAPEIRQKVESILAKIDLADIGDKYPSELSGGMQKRVALARALVTEPDIVLFDEPTAGLDPIRKNTVFALIEHSQMLFSFTAVVVTHELPDALFVADEVAVLDGGRIAFQGTPLAFEQCGGELAKTFLESDEALKNMMLGLQSKAELKLQFNALNARCAGWLMVSLSSFGTIAGRMGKIAAQAIMQAMVEAIRGFAPFGGDGFLLDTHTVIIALDATDNEAGAWQEAIATALLGSKYFQATTYHEHFVEIRVLCAALPKSAAENLHALLSMLHDNLTVAYELKHSESIEAV